MIVCSHGAGYDAEVLWIQLCALIAGLKCSPSPPPPQSAFAPKDVSTSLSQGLCSIRLVIVAQLRPTLWDPMDCNPPGSVHGFLQARILEWVAIPFSRRSSRPRGLTQVSRIAGRFFTI